MSLHWSWGLSTALILALVIWLNGQQIRAGWLLGAIVQLINMGFGLAYGQWTFAFLAIPAVMFLINWWRHPRRVHPQPLKPVDDDNLPEESLAKIHEYLKELAEFERRSKKPSAG